MLAHVPASTRVPTVFSMASALMLSLWLYAMHLVALIPHASWSGHALAAVGTFSIGCFLEWLRCRGRRGYASVFLLLATLAPLVYAYQHA